MYNANIFRSSQFLAVQQVSGSPSPLIGREQEVEALLTLIQYPDIRLITLVGPGGVGKTRLAMDAVGECSALFPDGIFFISLTQLEYIDAVLPVIARSLGINPRHDEQVMAAVHEHIRDKHILLVLDGFETVVGASSHLRKLLALCPSLKMLVTSQTILGLSEERTLHVGPLALPNLAYHHSCDELARTASIALFLQRVYGARPDFVLTPQNIYAIAEICVRLDGLPLALELAAARMKLFSPQELLARLNNRLSMLTGGSRGAPERQQTLRKTIARSYGLLASDEQHLFRLLAVFNGGSTFHAIEAVSSMVCGQSEQLFDSMTLLLDQSLVLYEPQLGTEDQRFRMLGTHWDYATELLLRSSDEEIIRQAHAEYYLDLANMLEMKVVQGGTPCWVELIKCEFDNLRAAFGWFMLTKDIERALHISAALWPFWLLNFSAEGQVWIKQALEQCSNSMYPVNINTKAKALHALAMLEYYKGNWSHADIFADEALLAFRKTGNLHGIARVLMTQATGALLRGLYAVASRAVQESIDILQALPHPWLMSEAQLVMAYSTYMQGDSYQAYRLGSHAFAARQLTNDLYTKMRIIYAQAVFANAQNRFGEVELLYDEAVGLTQATIKTGEGSPIAVCLMGLGALTALRKNYVSAVRIWASARVLCDRRDGRCDLEPYVWLQMMLTTHLLYTDVVADVRSQLDERTFHTAYLEAQSVTLQDILGHIEGQPQLSAAPTAKLALPYSDGLTPREREVLLLLAQGLSNAVIADQLVISLTTVNSHVRTIYSKLGVSSRSAATRYAMENNLA